MRLALTAFVFAAMSPTLISNVAAMVECRLACTTIPSQGVKCPQDERLQVGSAPFKDKDGKPEWQIKYQDQQKLIWYDGQANPDGSFHLKNNDQWVTKRAGHYQKDVQIRDKRKYSIGFKTNTETKWFYLWGSDECQRGAKSIDPGQVNTIIVTTESKM